MRLMFASDIHGSAFYCHKMIDAYRQEKADRIIILGDILYHGPRNDLPEEYNPRQVILQLNEIKEELYAIRGNCEAEVDQMVLEFPVMADYCVIMEGSRTIYASHGHIYHEGNLPPMKQQDIFIHGHTHIPRAEKLNNHILLNPGSVSLPKNGYAPSYGIMDMDQFMVKGFDGKIMMELDLAGE